MGTIGKFLTVLLLFSVSLSGETKILAFAGSTRAESANKKLVLEAVGIARKMGADVTFVDLKDYPLPLYEADWEAKNGMPKNAKHLQQLMIDSQVILIASPEYNASLSALLKNAIDWASRNGKGGTSYAAFEGKRFALMSASPGGQGGARGLIHLRAILEALGGTVLPQQVVVPDAYSAFDEKGKLKSQKLRAELQSLVRQFGSSLP